MKNYQVNTLEFAYDDMRIIKDFYEKQANNLGSYFVNSILTDIESLSFYGGIHQKYFGLYRMLAKRFPYAIYYDIEDNQVVIYAVLDLRANPKTNSKQLMERVL